MIERPRDLPAAPLYFVFSLVGLSLVLGGSSTLSAEATVTAGSGALFLLKPPARSPGPITDSAFIALLLLALAAFLPARFLPLPDWRVELLHLGVSMSPLVTPQPWLTLQSLLQLLLGMSWAYYIVAFPWNAAAREQTWRFVALLVTILASMLLVAWLLQRRIPFWPDTPEFGFFPNRNHTSDVLGLGGILIYAHAFSGFAERRRSWWLWLPPFSVVLSALVIDYSRAGLLLLISGIVAWHVFWLFSSKTQRRPILAGAAILLLVGLFVWIGGKTALRFVNESGDFFSGRNMRFAIYRDAIRLIGQAPFTGIGLRNFAFIFPTAQRYSIAEDIAAHPESDWIWAAVELGWLAPIALAILCGWWLRRTFPLSPGSFRLMRFAAIVCCVGFAVHAGLDVPGHRIAAILPPLLLAGTALHPRWAPQRAFVVPLIFRAIGAVLVATAAFWLLSLRTDLPTAATLDRLQEQIDNALSRRDYAAVQSAATKALRIAPLDWSAHHARGVAAVAEHQHNEARREFQIARYLLPAWSDLWFKEATAWLSGDEPDEAFRVWSAMLHRFPAEQRHLYVEIFHVVENNPSWRAQWRELARNDHSLLPIFFELADPIEFRLELASLLLQDADLSEFDDHDKSVLFAAWFRKGDRLALAEALQEHPHWTEIGWRELARSLADNGDFRVACEIAERHARLPEVPQVSAESAPELEVQRRLHPADTLLAARLCVALMNAGQSDKALAVLQALREFPGTPPWLPTLQVKLWSAKSDWPKAWQALAPLVDR